MKIDVAPVAAVTAPSVTDSDGVVVIDVLRATSTVITALAHGCRGFVPVGSAAAARRQAARLAALEPLLGGEYNGLKIKGFDLGNSPREYSPTVVTNRTIVFCTTNGSRALLRARGAAEVLVAALLNVSAVARRLSQQRRDWLFFCAGARGNFSWEDFLCAGLVLAALAKMEANLELGDGARAALELVRDEQDGARLVSLGSHAAYLRSLGLAADVDFCARQDVYDVVPVYRDGWLLNKPGTS
jgi:2-phosphosulfolactate phosphatase